MIDIVICVHNGLDAVRQCLESVRSKTAPEHRLIIVDDGSGAPTEQYLHQYANRFPCTLIRNNSARGYTASANMGLRQSKAPYCVLLNSDTIVTNRWLEKLTETMESDSRIGIVGPLSNAASWQSVPTLELDKNMLPPNMTVEQMAELVLYSSDKKYPRVPFLNGFCLMIRRQVIERIGYFDEKNFPIGYGEEDDFCLRARAANFKLKVATHCYIYHQKSISFGLDRRRELSRSGRSALNRKYGEAVMKQLQEKMADHQQLREIRQRIRWLLRCNRKINTGNQRRYAVYTAITGDYDQLKEPLQISEDCDYFCFTDNPDLRSATWKIVLLNRKLFPDPARLARWVKMMPHLFFRSYEYSVWVDGNIRVVGSMSRFIRKYSASSPMALYKHSLRSCTYKEADACIALNKDRREIIREQIEAYRREGYPANNGLIESGVILRRHNDPLVIRTMTAWWRQIARYSKRDQLSFNYVAWKNNVSYTVIEDYIRDNEFFKWSKHERRPVG